MVKFSTTFDISSEGGLTPAVFKSLFAIGSKECYGLETIIVPRIGSLWSRLSGILSGISGGCNVPAREWALRFEKIVSEGKPTRMSIYGVGIDFVFSDALHFDKIVALYGDGDFSAEWPKKNLESMIPLGDPNG